MKKSQLLLCLAIGNLMGALLWNPPGFTWDLESWATDSINGVHRSLTGGGGGGSNEPLPVPQVQPPIGNSATIQPCAVPPSMAVSTPTSSPTTSVAASGDRFKDRKAKILMNVAIGNRLTSVYSRLNSPDYTEGMSDFWVTSDGLIKVTHDSTYRIASIEFVK